MQRSIILFFLICSMMLACNNNKTPTELIETFNYNKKILGELVSRLQNDKALDTLFQIAPDSGLPDIKASYPEVYRMLKEVGITDASSCKNPFPKGTSWYYFKTNWPNEYPIYLNFNAYKFDETEKGFYSKDEVSNETWGLGDNWKMFRFVKFKPYEQ